MKPVVTTVKVVETVQVIMTKEDAMKVFEFAYFKSPEASEEERLSADVLNLLNPEERY